ncbi:hypothetical protein LEN26_017863 [Aphanomyces euteiches]|nr:hypothetical protein LEN26_017863 [Aphanomyces euteiches]KAH9102396.1 hypothetical protein AeMF1_021004 [Aphanomyces euteiches]KAH9185211.1 hypothetical protein AeNC1_012817 [Aphanomyces euteiches]
MQDVIVIPVLNDNYSYLLIDRASKTAGAVDPVEPEKVIRVAEEYNVTITHVLTTHAHADHDGGNLKIKQLLPEVIIVGGKNDNVKAVTHEVGDQDVVTIGQLQVRVFSTPCHTVGHVLYLSQDALFTGDTLFVAGCGRFFMGTADQMHYALNHVVAKLPLDTKIYCGHEYTSNNLKFAVDVEPDNKAVADKFEWSLTQTITIPSTVESELATNPFMRVEDPAVQKYAGSTDPVEVMAILRERKNTFGLGAGKK